MSNKENNLIICPICGQQFFKRGFNAHIKKFHSEFTDKEKISLWLRCFHQDMFPKDYSRDIAVYLIKHKIYTNWKAFSSDKNILLPRRVAMFYESLRKRYEWNPEIFEKPSGKSIEILYEYLIPFKNSNPKYASLSNGKEICLAFCRGNQELADKMFAIERTHNPGYQHDGSLSPFSKDFKGYQGLSEEEKVKIIRTRNTSKERPDYYERGLDKVKPNQIGFWLKQGYSEAEAKLKLRERQNTRSYKTQCELYGEVEGKKRVQASNKKWIKSLMANPENSVKISKGQYKGAHTFNTTSAISLELFNFLNDKLKDKYECLYGDTEKFISFEDGTYCQLDFYIPKLKAAVEYDGAIWHQDIEKDKLRDKKLQALGIRIYRVPNDVYHNNPEITANSILHWILNETGSNLTYVNERPVFKAIEYFDKILKPQFENKGYEVHNSLRAVKRIITGKRFDLQLTCDKGNIFVIIKPHNSSVKFSYRILTNFKENFIRLIKAYIWAENKTYTKTEFLNRINELKYNQ